MSGRYKTYPEYKDSGVEWLEKIPKSWFMIKFGITNSKAELGGNYTSGVAELGLPLIKMGNLGRGNINLKQLEHLPLNVGYENNHILNHGDFLFNTRNSMKLVGKVAIWRGEIKKALYNSNILRISFHKKFIRNTSFMNYLFNSVYGLSKLNLVSKGTTSVAAIYYKELKSIVFPLPTLNEQTQIANFLDHETAKIDKLIEKQQQLIKLLEEKRQAIISHAVTKGLNPNAPMKDSGIEWLGEVPAHWEIKRFKRIFKIKKDIAGKLGYKVLSVTQKGIKVKDIESGEGQLSMDYSKYQLVNIGDFAINQMDLLTGSADISKLIGVTSPDYRVFTLQDTGCCPEYLRYFLLMCYRNKIFYAFGQGAANLGRWRLQTSVFKLFKATIPPLNEQKCIADFIHSTLARMETLTNKAHKGIALLQERRTALISAAVTGKIDVRDWSCPNKTKQGES